MYVCTCEGEYVFTVDCRCDSVDIIFTDNETNSVTRHHVLDRRQQKIDSLRSTDAANEDDIDTVNVDYNEPSQVSSALYTAATATCTIDSCAIQSTAATVSCCLTAEPESHSHSVATDSYDDDSSTDEDCNILSSLNSFYTKDAFHRYIIAGQLQL